MTALETFLLIVLAVALWDKLLDLDHECWRDGCAECQSVRVRERAEAHR
jgi:hypothetical protein